MLRTQCDSAEINILDKPIIHQKINFRKLKKEKEVLYMKYIWKIVMADGKVYKVKSHVSDGEKFVQIIFTTGFEKTISFHTLTDGSSVIINSDFVSSIEFNCKNK